MEVIFKEGVFDDLNYFRRSGNKVLIDKIDSLLKAIAENPCNGIGKPEKLKENLSGYWSRRINLEHRIIYTVEETTVTIYSLRGHYER
jgi:toxin YoeB